MVLYNVFRGINIFLVVIRYIILAYCVMSWFVRPYNQFFVLLRNIVQPLMAPFRPISNKLLRRGFMIDISPFLALIALELLNQLMWQLYFLIV